MQHRSTSLPLIPLLAVAWTLFAAAELRAQRVLDPQLDYEEFHAEAAVHPDGDVLLTWTRQQEPGEGWSVMAATLDPNSGQLGELHEWGPGGAEQVVPLGSGYLAVRQNVDPNPEWFVQRLDETGEPVGAAMQLDFAVIHTVAAQATPDGGAMVVAGGAGGTGAAVRAWRFDPDGTLLAGPVTLADSSIVAAAGVDGAGNLVLAWSDVGRRVFARRFSPDLQPLGPEVPVALGGANDLRVAVAPDGRFVVVFAQSYQLRTRAFRADGTAASGRIAISPRRDFVSSGDFSVATGPDGEILVVWKTYANLNVPTVQARFLSFNGRPSSPLLRLAHVPGGRGNLLRPRVETLPEGDFLVLWTQVNAAEERLTLRSRRFDR